MTTPYVFDEAGRQKVTEFLASMQDEITRERVLRIIPQILELVAREGHAGRLALAAAGVLLLPQKRPATEVPS